MAKQSVEFIKLINPASLGATLITAVDEFQARLIAGRPVYVRITGVLTSELDGMLRFAGDASLAEHSSDLGLTRR
jgi:hypothetical protein